MPVTPEKLDALTADIVRLYEGAQLRILEDISRRLNKGGTAGRWQMEKLAEIQPLLRLAKGELGKIPPEALSNAVSRAYLEGARDALADLLDGPEEGVRAMADTLARATPLLTEMRVRQAQAHNAILRNTEDIYRSVLSRAIGASVLGVETQRTVMEKALGEFAQQGITAFIDNKGRRWEMGSYIEMAVRTGAARAAQKGHMDQLTAQGHDLVMVSDHAQECPMCAPFEGRVLSVQGVNDPDAMCSVDEARMRGLNHPGCRHRFKAYFPGVTKAPQKEQRKQSDYEARMRQRDLERGIRQWKRRAAVGDPQAPAKVRAWQARLREHIAANDLKRQPHRESPMRGN